MSSILQDLVGRTFHSPIESIAVGERAWVDVHAPVQLDARDLDGTGLVPGLYSIVHRRGFAWTIADLDAARRLWRAESTAPGRVPGVPLLSAGWVPLGDVQAQLRRAFARGLHQLQRARQRAPAVWPSTEQTIAALRAEPWGRPYGAAWCCTWPHLCWSIDTAEIVPRAAGTWLQSCADLRATWLQLLEEPPGWRPLTVGCAPPSAEPGWVRAAERCWVYTGPNPSHVRESWHAAGVDAHLPSL